MSTGTKRIGLGASAFISLNALMSTHGAQAQSEEQARGAMRLEEVVVEARRTAENIQDVPVSITAISAEELGQAPIANPEDFQFLSPGLVASQSFRSNDNVRFTIRGQSQADVLLNTDSSVGIYIDGVYMARTWGTRSGLLDLERVEILKGPQGTLYGKNTTGGAVSMYTRKPDLDAAGGFVKVSGGEFNTREVEGALNLPLVANKLGLRLAAGYEQSDGFGEDSDGRDLGDYDNRVARLHLLYQVNDDLSLRLSGDYSKNESRSSVQKTVQILPPPSGLLTDVNLERFGFAWVGQPGATATLTPANFGATFAQVTNSINTKDRYHTGSSADADTQFEGKTVSLTADWDLGWAALKSISAYRTFERSAFQDQDATPFDAFFSDTSTDADFWSQEVLLNGRILRDRVGWVSGVFYSDEEGTERSDSTVLPRATGNLFNIQDNDVTNKTTGVFGQATFDVTDRLSLTGGVRWTEEKRAQVSRNRNVRTAVAGGATVCQLPASLLPPGSGCELDLGEKTFSAWSWVASVAFKVTSDINAYATTRRGFRGGGSNTGVNTNIASIKFFDPEYARDVEVGLKSEWLDGRLRANVAAFHTDYTDIQKTIVIATSAGLQTVVDNAAEATIKGVELDIQALATDSLTLGLTAAWTDAGYDTFLIRNAAGAVIQDRSSEPFEVPEYTYSLMAAYTIPLPAGELTARADWYWRDEVIFASSAALLPSEPILREDAYGLLSARIEWSLPQLEVALVGRNLLDKEYWVAGLDIRALGLAMLIPGQPRYLGVEFVKRFGGG